MKTSSSITLAVSTTLVFLLNGCNEGSTSSAHSSTEVDVENLERKKPLKIFSSNIPIISQYIIKKDLDAIIFLA